MRLKGKMAPTSFIFKRAAAPLSPRSKKSWTGCTDFKGAQETLWKLEPKPRPLQQKTPSSDPEPRLPISGLSASCGHMQVLRQDVNEVSAFSLISCLRITAIFIHSASSSEAQKLLDNCLINFMARWGLFPGVDSKCWLMGTFNIRSWEVRMQMKEASLGQRNKTTYLQWQATRRNNFRNALGELGKTHLTHFKEKNHILTVRDVRSFFREVLGD